MRVRRFTLRTWVLIIVGTLLVGFVGRGTYALLLGGSSSNQAITDIELQRGLVGWWKLDGNAKDSTPYAQDGTLRNSPSLTADRKGKANSAYSFNGSTSKISIPNTGPYTAFGTNSFSVCSWVSTADSGTAKGIVSITGDGQGWRFGISAGKPYYLIGDSTLNSESTIGTTTFNDSLWHNLCIVYTYTTNWVLTAYIDGNSTGSTAGLNIGSVNRISSPAIGAIDANVNSNVLNGSVDDVRIYNRTLSAGEVSALSKQYDPSIQAATGENGLIGHWKLDGNAKDASPYGNNGTVNGATLTSDRKGRANSAYSFNGSSYISLPSFNVANKISVCAWVMPTISQTSKVVGKHSSSTDIQGTLGIASGKAQFEITINGTAQSVSPTSVLALNQWSLICGTYDGATVSVYVNADAPVTLSASGPIATNAFNWSIGSLRGGTTASAFTGSIDDVRIYNRALLAGEIKRQYESYGSQIGSGGGNVNLQSGLVGYWPLNGNAKDTTPYGNNGMVSGATLVSDRKGRANGGYSFGNPNNIRVPYDPIQMPTSAVTLSVWFRSNVAVLTGAQGQRLAGNMSGTSGYALIATGATSTDACGTSVLCFRIKVNGTMTFATYANSNLTDNTWYHVVGVYDGSSVRLYVNGIQVNSTGATGSITAATNSFCMGSSPNANTDCLGGNYLSGNGAIDDVRVYNRALSATEIAVLAKSYN